ncbi:MAG: NADH oxidoreductase (quinone) subunit F [Deltaproteobacteria bacterium RIFOXYA12_FULL_61_11]|nr:MAG: NADH oxidoreductase (quinone) subunit F [Deltaproteobacteria bacterium RIFOXYA12_FULL_61_11]
MDKEPILTKRMHLPGSHTLAVYESVGGYQSLRKALAMEPAAVIDEVKKSGLRGRGGAGFPTGLKWSFVPKESTKPKYLCCNADEGEPGTFKDRVILEKDPHSLIEGMLIASWAVGIRHGYIYVRGEFLDQIKILQGAIDEAYAKGYLGKGILGTAFDCDLTVHRGAGAYVCGEETALINSIEGKRGQPRLKPPFPAVVGLFGGPTVVNNVETLAAVPWILERGAAAYVAYGTEKSTGSKLFSVSGPVKNPGVYEIELGYPLMDFLNNECGGLRDGTILKAIIVGGSSVPILTAAECEGARLDYESLQQKGTMLGSGGMIVFPEGANMVRLLTRLAKFYAHESCGQCTPCREGSGFILRMLEQIYQGHGKLDDLDNILRVANNMTGNTICPLADAMQMPVVSWITKFRKEFEQYIISGQRGTGARHG